MRQLGFHLTSRITVETLEELQDAIMKHYGRNRTA
jgi:hypothetical protein